MVEVPSLRERNRARARERIIGAAFALFAERGFADVTVADIAERAEVGRTTFFRYFGDKQEVVFADEQSMLDGLVAHHRASMTAPPADLADALAAIRTVVVAMCAEATRDEPHYAEHERLLDSHPELRDREVRKMRRFTEAVGQNLRERGASELVAVLAPQLALACYHAGHRLAGADPAALPGAVDAAFEQCARLGYAPA